jgi:hypothetical protein
MHVCDPAQKGIIALIPAAAMRVGLLARVVDQWRHISYSGLWCFLSVLRDKYMWLVKQWWLLSIYSIKCICTYISCVHLTISLSWIVKSTIIQICERSREGFMLQKVSTKLCFQELFGFPFILHKVFQNVLQNTFSNFILHLRVYQMKLI